MGKIARIGATILNLVAILSGGPNADASGAIEKGDTLARGQRAMAFLGAVLLMFTIISAPLAYDTFVQPFLTTPILLSCIAAGIIIPLAFFILIDRRISRAESARADAPKA